ncbi:cytochrome P450 [Acidicapsa dinghuensis]|uniref:Cytochrome P450 n=1 Tax=Acidicapsa dinghuensis TaxID=2218256 RepID=A0ABW1EI69_9BACT|nr:cytochrome P450 [Acidicapsa dinghuensis]
MAVTAQNVRVNGEAAVASDPIIHKGKYRFPPGLRLNLPLYTGRSFFDRTNPILLFEYLQRYGRAAHYRLLWHHIVLLNDPSDIREVLVDKAQCFIKERTQKRMKILLGDGLITADGEVHKRHRRIAAPAFHRQRIQAYASTIVEYAAAMADEWKPGKQMDVAAEMMRLALRITARTLFDTEVTEEIHAINDEANAVMDIYNDLIAMPRAEDLLRWRVPIPVLKRFQRSKDRLDSVVDRMIARKREEMVRVGREAESARTDLLSMLIAARDEEARSGGLSDLELRDEVMTIFLAGYETVANALAWTWLLLGQNPEVEAELIAELRRVLGGRLPTLDDVAKLTYTEMVFAEAMRLYPPAWAMGRQAICDVEIGPYHFPKGTFLFFSQYIVHRDQRFYDEPLEFRTERFTPEAKAQRPRFAYFPFGGGGRQCIGESFAWMEGVLVLATLAQRWQLDVVKEQKIALQPKITLRPKHGIRVIPHMRQK